MFKKKLKSKSNFIEKRPEIKWWVFNLQTVLNKLYSSENGLSGIEAEKRRIKSGLNILPRKKQEGLLDVLWNQIKSSMVVVLVIAALLSFILNDIIDGFVILLAVLINIIVGFSQEFKTSRALEALQKIVVNYAKILRDGEEKLIENVNLVPGDIVILSAGDKVPADLRLFKVNGFKINEAILTGESQAKEKQNKILADKIILAERINMAFMGTIVVEGNARGVVVETGNRTAIGKIAELVSEIKIEKTPLQHKLDRFAIFLTKVVLAITAIILIIGVILGHSFREMFVTSVAVAVAAIPEGLAVTVTVVLAVGMQRILKSNALVKRLLSAEILGSTNVICADKTGTITQGKMQVVKIVTEDMDIDLKTGLPDLTDKAAEQQLFLLRIGMLCNNAYVAEKKEKLSIDHLVGNLTEKALLLAGLNIGIDKQALEKEYPRLDEIPFNSQYKFMMTLNKFDRDHNIIYLKGAPEKVLLFSNYIYSHHIKKHLELNSYRREKFIKMYEDMSKQGLRVLAIGYKKVSSQIKSISDNNNVEQANKQAISELYTNFVLVGLVGIKDPIRENVQETLEITKKAGMQTVMITGDNKFTAKVIAEEIGLDVNEKNILQGEDLQAMSDSEFKQKVENIKLYARTTPEDKLKIVRAWQEKNKVVAMTGDGVNDAPALKQADIGIALGTATDVAKESSDLILLNNNFRTIVEAVRQGRIIFANIKKIILYFLSDSMAEVTIILVGLLLKWPLPILASQIIWVNLIDDTFPALALTQDPASYDVMQDKPIKKNANILDLESKVLVGLISFTTALFVLITFWLFWQGKEMNLDLARTMSFAVLGTSSLFYVFSVRNLKNPIWQTKFFNNKFLIGSVILGLFLQSIAIYNPFLQNIFHTVPLNFWQWFYVILVGVLVILVIEFIKWVFVRFKLNK
ncbi:HAD-IC family P-type ATPase [Patescibacteria group bacterium]|nr:HAD-IC family P-type ATPase [Patescibacteria group bacterium]